MNNLSKARLAIVAILISVLVATFIVGPGVYRIRLEKQKANLYAKGAAALATHQWGEALRPFDRVYPEQGRRAQGKLCSGQALAQFEKLSLLDSNYRNGGERLIEAHYLAGVVYLEAGQFNQAVSEFSQVSLDYRDTEDKLAQALDGSMVHVPAGEFIMGNDSGNPDERPQRPVYLDAFEMDKYEVTNVQYRRFIQATNPGPPHLTYLRKTSRLRGKTSSKSTMSDCSSFFAVAGGS